jgi:hypothetical protein
MWRLKSEYNEVWPALVGLSSADALTVLALRGGWITEGYEGRDENYFTDKFEFIEAR